MLALKGEVEKISINKWVNVLTTLKNLETKLDDLYVCKLKTVPVDLNTLRDVADNEVVKSKNLNTLKIKVNNIDERNPDATTLIHINQYNTQKNEL